MLFRSRHLERKYNYKIGVFPLSDFLTTRLAHEVGLELVWRKSFREILEEYKNVEEFRLLLDKMGIHDDFGNFEVSTEEWGLSSLYTAFVFRKMR